MRWTPSVELSPREQRLCHRLEKHRRFYRFLRLHRQLLLDDAFQERLATLYSDTPRGTPPKPPAMLAAVVLLQAYSGASDDDALQLCETDARWQMVLDCLGDEDAPFGKATLVDFRTRLVQAGMHKELLQRTVALAKQTRDFGYKQAAGLQIAIDSVPLEGVGKVEDTLNLLGRALRLLVQAVAAMLAMTPQQVIAQVPLPVLQAPSIKAGLDRNWDEPGAKDAALHDLLGQVQRLEDWIKEQCPGGLQTYEVAQAKEQLEKLRAQDIEPDGKGGARIRQGVAPDRQISISDPEMRHGRKSQTQRIDGYKQYQALDLDNDLTVAAAVLPANVAESQGAEKLRPEVEALGKVERLHIDRAFLSSPWVNELTSQDAEAVVCRAPVSSNQGLYTKQDFKVDVAAGTVTCPAGQVAVIQQESARFATQDCQGCAQRPQCQKPEAKQGRTIHVGPNEPLLQRLGAQTKTPQGRQRLRRRVRVEHAQAHHVRRQGGRARYRGVLKNDFDACRIAAVNNLLVIDRRLRIAEEARLHAG